MYAKSKVRKDQSNEDDDVRLSLRQKAHDLFALCDLENKGFASKRDMYRLIDELTLTPDQLDEVFDALDKDKNDCLTLQEFTEGLGMFLGIEGHLIMEDEESQNIKDSALAADTKSDGEDEDFEELLEELGAQTTFQEEDYIRHMWLHLKQDDPSMLENFESFLGKITQELNKSKREYSSLENVLKNRTNVHEEQVQALYNEMQQQLQDEKEHILANERLKEQKLRDELESELYSKDKELQDLLVEHAQMEKQLEELNSMDSATKYENVKLQKERDGLERRLSSSDKTLTDLQTQLNSLRKKSLDEKRKRAKAAFKVSEDIALEREDLVKELQQLKQVNRQLLDEKDELFLSASTNPISASADESSSTSVKILNSGHTQSPLGHKWKVKDNKMILDLFQKGDSSTVVVSPLINDPLLNPIEKIERNLLCTTECPMTLDNAKSEDECEVDDDYFLENNPQLLGLSPKERATLQNNLNIETSVKHRTHAPFLMRIPEEGIYMDQNERSPSPQTVLKNVTTNSAQDSIKEQKELLPQRIFKVVFLGDSAVGKTSFIHRFCHDSFRETFNATVGVDFQVKTMFLEDRIIALQLWDTAGQERFRSITQQYYRKADGIVVMYDVTTENSFKNVRNWVTHVKENSDENVVLMLIGNKIDLCESEDNRVVKSKHGSRLADEFGTLFYETSAKSGDSLQEAMEGLSRVLQDKEDEVMEKVLRLHGVLKNKRKCC